MFTFTQGLFKFDFTDHHAILGVSLDAEFAEVRRRYMRLARHLHPDTCPLENETDKVLANQLLSTLVSPAYNKFSKESYRVELFVILKKLGNNITQQSSPIEFTTDQGQQIAKGGNYQEIYKVALQELSDRQYKSLDQTLEIIGKISDLNLAYLLQKQAQDRNFMMLQRLPLRVPSSTRNQNTSTTVKPKNQNYLVEQAYRRAETLISTKNYSKAILELKGALKIEPSHSCCHALLGFCYFQQNQSTMAKIQIKKALSLNPQNPKALEVKQILEQVEPINTARKKTVKVAGKTEKSSGLFGGFFSRNKQ